MVNRELDTPILGAANLPLAPAILGLDQLMHRHGVEEFIRDQNHWPLWHGGQTIVPLDGMAAHGALLFLAQKRAEFDEVDLRLRQKPRRCLAAGAQGIGHQGAAAGAKLHEMHRCRLAHQAPDMGAPQTEQLPEHLRHFGGGDKVSPLAEGGRASHNIPAPDGRR